MAFKIYATLKGYRLLSKKSGVSKAGKPWMALTVFQDGATAEVSTTDDAVMAACANLREMDVVNLDVCAVSGKERDYIILLRAPYVVSSTSDDEVGF